MKYLISLILGMAVGSAAFVALLYYNPFAAQNKLSPLSVTDNDLITFNYSAVAEDALVYTNDGESRIAPHPAKVLQLWEPTVRHTDAMATILRDSRGQAAAIGIKFSSDSDSTKILNSEAIVDSIWHVYVPGKGSLFVSQQENLWSYARAIVIPAHLSSANSWRGSWSGTMTSGPGALNTARVVGGSGVYVGLEADGVESLNAKAYSANSGPVAIDGELVIELPRQETVFTPDP